MPPATLPIPALDPHAVVANDFFSNAATSRVGLEIEVFVRRRSGERRLNRFVLWRLMSIVATEFQGTLVHSDASGPSIHLRSGGVISFEPAGQLEYAGPPLDSSFDAVFDALEFIERLERTLAGHGFVVILQGFDSGTTGPLLLVRKPRYLAMDRYFHRIGPYGRMMMRRTCSLQINLDFGGVGVNQERWRLANMISPALNALFPNSYYTERGATHPSYRYEIWRHTDPSRTGRLFDRPDLDPVADYLRFAMDARVMLVNENGSVVTPDYALSFRSWITDGWKGRFPKAADWRLHLTTLFPDVRPRGWMEIRSVDAQPKEMIGPVVSLVATVLYKSSLRASLLRLLEGRDRIREGGTSHDGYWRSDLNAGIDIAQLAVDSVSYRPWRTALERHIERSRS